jgi:hypothetical protein
MGTIGLLICLNEKEKEKINYRYILDKCLTYLQKY